MPIKGLTDRGASFPQIGVLRKGGPKQNGRFGKELDHFRFDTDDQDALEVFTEAYPGEPRRINVYLPYGTTDENFETSKEAWSASALQHRCDGEVCSRWIDARGKYHTEPTPCPGGCKEVGRLKIIIPELRRLVYVVAETHSIHDIINITEQLTALEMLRGSLRGIPLVLSRVAREISTPRPDGSRARVKKWLMSIEAAPSWVELQLQAEAHKALPGATRGPLLLSEPQQVLETERGAMDAGTGELVDVTPAKAPDNTKYVSSVVTFMGVADAVGVEYDGIPNLEKLSIDELTGIGTQLRTAIVKRVQSLAEEYVGLGGDPVTDDRYHTDVLMKAKPSDLRAFGKALIRDISHIRETAQPVAPGASYEPVEGELVEEAAL